MNTFLNLAILSFAVLIGWRFLQANSVRAARRAARRARAVEQERGLQAMTKSVLQNRTARHVGFAPCSVGAGVLASALPADDNQVRPGPLLILDSLATGVYNPADPMSDLALHNALNRGGFLGPHGGVEGHGWDGAFDGSFGSDTFGLESFGSTDSSSGFGPDSWS